MRSSIFGATIILTAATALAHTGVQNPAVLERMDAMKTIGDAMETLGNMARGKIAFDADSAQAAASEIADHAAETPTLFEARETDPKSEAKDAIWSDFADFTQKSEALARAAREISASLETRDALVPSVRKLGEACKVCQPLSREISHGASHAA